MANITLPSILGLPPLDLDVHTNQMILNSMPTAEIFPSKAEFSGGYDLFRLRDAMNDYKTLLNGYKYNISGDSIKVAFLADSFPTDTFSNEYGENFLQKLTDVASEGVSGLNQMMGTTSGTEAMREIIGRMNKAGGLFKTAGGILGDVGDYGSKLADVLAPKGSGRQRLLNAANELAAGGRIDFPNLWKSSSYQPSYTMTVRLYNPDPRSDSLTKQYIIGPIAALMLMGIPLTRTGGTYSWPFLHRVVSTGIYNLDPAFIQSVTVIKGGDQQQISYGQRLGIVDVRIDFGSLYNTMVAGTNVTAGRPTLAKYLKALEPKRSVANNQGDVLDTTKTISTPKLAPKVEERVAGNVSSRTDAAKKEAQDGLNLILAARSNRFADQN